MNTNSEELSTEELDCVSGGGIASDLAAGARAVAGLINAGLGALTGGGGVPSGGHSGGAPKSTWL
jgi:bacteriocin-like protein